MYTKSDAIGGETADRAAMAGRILARLLDERLLRPLLERGYEIDVSGEAGFVAATAAPIAGEGACLVARINVADWWDAKELTTDEWARQLSHALAVALRREARLGTERGRDDRPRYAVGSRSRRRLRLRVALVAGTRPGIGR